MSSFCSAVGDEYISTPPITERDVSFCSLFECTHDHSLVVALCVAAIAIVVLLGSVVHSLRLPVLLWDAVLRAGQLAIVRHWPGSGATCPFPGHYRSGRVPGKGWRDWCCWSYQGGFWGTGVCDGWSSSGWDLITFEKCFCDIWWSLKSQKSNVIS